MTQQVNFFPDKPDGAPCLNMFCPVLTTASSQV